jgi:CheY-like chemotaxis protein
MKPIAASSSIVAAGDVPDPHLNRVVQVRGISYLIPDGEDVLDLTAMKKGKADSRYGSSWLLDRVVQGVSACVTEAAKSRGAQGVDSAKAERYARTLIDVADQKRILWVDDEPDNNRLETAALAKLQIEVVAVTSTEAALARLDSDPERFDLVLSDWQLPESDLSTLSAGIHLLRQVRKHHPTVPVVFYHGSGGKRERAVRRKQALREGAFGEAVMPDKLLKLVIKALALQ